MCRWLAYLGEARPLEDLLYEQSHSLVEQSSHSTKAKLGVHGDGVGIGWYNGRTYPGLYRDAVPAWNDHNLREICHHTTSRLFFAHVRASTGAPALFTNCHPFRYKEWLGMHNGQVGDYHLLSRAYEAGLADHLHAQKQGSTDSEAMFLKIVQLGLKQDPPQALRRAFTEMYELGKQVGSTRPLRATFALTNGEVIWVVRWSSDALSPSLYFSQEGASCSIASEPLDDDISSWQSVPENILMTFKQGQDTVSITQEPFLPA